MDSLEQKTFLSRLRSNRKVTLTTKLKRVTLLSLAPFRFEKVELHPLILRIPIQLNPILRRTDIQISRIRINRTLPHRIRLMETRTIQAIHPIQRLRRVIQTIQRIQLIQDIRYLLPADFRPIQPTQLFLRMEMAKVELIPPLLRLHILQTETTLQFLRTIPEVARYRIRRPASRLRWRTRKSIKMLQPSFRRHAPLHLLQLLEVWIFLRTISIFLKNSKG